MRFGDLFRRESITQDEYHSLEANLADAILSEEFSPGPASHGKPSSAGEDQSSATNETADAASDETSLADGSEGSEDIAPVSEYVHARLAEVSAFEHMHDVAAADLETVAVAVAQIKIAQRQTKEFLSGVHSSIHRLSELEMENNKILADNRSLFRQAEHVTRLRSQQEGLMEAFKQREEKLAHAAEAARRSLAAVKLDLVECQAQVASHLAERQHLQKAMASATTYSERTMRESEILRERLATLAADVEVASRRCNGAERKFEELTSLHSRTAADNAELRLHLSTVEAERQRLQKQHDALQAKYAECVDSLKINEAEAVEQAKRYDVSFVNLRDERDTLAARLEHSERAHVEASQKVAALNAALDESLTRKRLTEDGTAQSGLAVLPSSVAEVVVERRNAVSKVRAQVAERVVADRDRSGKGPTQVDRIS